MSAQEFHMTVKEFRGKTAVLEGSIESDTFVIPIQKLPTSIEEGSDIVIKIFTPEDAKHEYDHIARAILNELIA